MLKAAIGAPRPFYANMQKEKVSTLFSERKPLPTRNFQPERAR
jgi:hypothetical protein